MNLKKQVVERIKKKLEDEQRKLKMKAETNAYQINNLAEENTVIKREVAKIGDLIKSLENDS